MQRRYARASLPHSSPSGWLAGWFPAAAAAAAQRPVLPNPGAGQPCSERPHPFWQSSGFALWGGAGPQPVTGAQARHLRPGGHASAAAARVSQPGCFGQPAGSGSFGAGTPRGCCNARRRARRAPPCAQRGAPPASRPRASAKRIPRLLASPRATSSHFGLPPSHLPMLPLPVPNQLLALDTRTEARAVKSAWPPRESRHACKHCCEEEKDREGGPSFAHLRWEKQALAQCGIRLLPGPSPDLAIATAQKYSARAFRQCSAAN